MRTLIIYKSYHHMNTERVAKAMADAMGARLVKVGEADPASLAEYDLIGFGSGIYRWKHHEELLAFVERLPPMSKAAFIFSTSGAAWARHGLLRGLLRQKGFSIVGEFNCRGYDTMGPLRLIGGIAKGRPDEDDLAKARAFALGLKA